MSQTGSCSLFLGLNSFNVSTEKSLSHLPVGKHDCLVNNHLNSLNPGWCLELENCYKIFFFSLPQVWIDVYFIVDKLYGKIRYFCPCSYIFCFLKNVKESGGGDNVMPTMFHSDNCGGTHWKTSFSLVKWLKSPKMPKERKASRIIRAKSNLITESLLLISYRKLLEGGFCRHVTLNMWRIIQFWWRKYISLEKVIEN